MDPVTSNTDTATATTPAPATTADSTRADILAGLEAIGNEPVPEAAPTLDSPQDTPVETKATEVAPEVEPVVDADTAKRIAAVQKQEKRARDALAVEKAALEKERAEWASVLEEARGFADLKSRAKYDPAAALAALGLGEDDFEPAAKDLYARSKAAQANPAAREAAAKMQRERQYADKVSALEAKLASLESSLTEKQRQADYDQAWNNYYGDVSKTVKTSDDAPLLRAHMDKNPQRAQQMVQQAANYLFQQTGEWPEASDVVATYEQNRRRELEELGIPVDEVLKRKPKVQAAQPITPTPPATTPTKTLAPNMAAATPGLSADEFDKLTPDQRKAKVLQELMALDS